MNKTLVLLLASLVLAACAQTEPPVAATAPVATWDDFVSSYIEETLVARPSFAVVQGRHEFDGLLPDYSRAGIEAEVSRLEAARAEALAFTGLTPEQAFQREYVVSRLDHDLFWMRDSGKPYTNPTFYTDWLMGGIDPSVYLVREYAPLAERMAAYTRFAEGIPEVAGHIRANMRLPMAKPLAEIGALVYGGFGTFFANDVPGIFESVADERFAAANTAAAAAMTELGAWFASEAERGTDAFALGPELFQQMLYMTERVETPIAELKAKGEADMARNFQMLADACQEFAPGARLPDCIAKMQANKPEGGSVEAARRQLVELRAFVEAKDLVSIPGTEEALVAESPPYARWNFAYIDIPGPFEEGMPSVYNIAPPDPSWSEADQLAYIPGEANLLFVSAHEVWPGHFLNFLHANRSDDLFGRVFVGYAFAEGWAHYTEEMMWDAGLRDGDPEAHIGQLSNALLRNARYLCAIGLHTGGMTMDECETLFRERALQDPGTARQQAARGTFDPAYLNYTMGKLLIRDLRDDWTASRGGREAWKAFHDEFLSYGGPPIPLVREQMMESAD